MGMTPLRGISTHWRAPIMPTCQAWVTRLRVRWMTRGKNAVHRSAEPVIFHTEALSFRAFRWAPQRHKANTGTNA